MTETLPLTICTDLDRTLLPNGEQPESPDSRRFFAQLCASKTVNLVYVSGRDMARVIQAVSEYDLPVPDFVISDVGTKINKIESSVIKGEQLIRSENLLSWERELDMAGSETTFNHIRAHLEGVVYSRLQKNNQQNTHKVSMQTIADVLPQAVDEITKVTTRWAKKIRIIASIDETKNEGLIDIVPLNSGKLLAINHLVDHKKWRHERVIYSGDSGNDTDVLLSGYKAIVVNNATKVFKQDIFEKAKQRNSLRTLYFASGILNGLNGNYSAGIIEGCLHFFPEYEDYLSNLKVGVNSNPSFSNRPKIETKWSQV